MVKVISLMLVLFYSFFCVSLFADGINGEDGGSYIVDRGIFGVVYKVLEVTGKTIEAIIFGRYGVSGVKDYFQINKIFRKRSTTY